MGMKSVLIEGCLSFFSISCKKDKAWNMSAVLCQDVTCIQTDEFVWHISLKVAAMKRGVVGGWVEQRKGGKDKKWNKSLMNSLSLG